MAGRPTKDTVDTHRLILNLARQGMTNTQIAKATGLSLRTIQYWLAESDLGESVSRIRAGIQTLEDAEKTRLNKSAVKAVTRLLKKHKNTETIQRTDENGKLLYTETRTKEIEPNAGIVQFVLKNTDPKSWSDTPEDTQADGMEDTEIRIEINDD